MGISTNEKGQAGERIYHYKNQQNHRERKRGAHETPTSTSDRTFTAILATARVLQCRIPVRDNWLGLTHSRRKLMVVCFRHDYSLPITSAADQHPNDDVPRRLAGCCCNLPKTKQSRFLVADVFGVEGGSERLSVRCRWARSSQFTARP